MSGYQICARPNKRFLSSKWITRPYPGSTQGVIVALPGVELADIKEALNNRTITTRQRIIAVEADKSKQLCIVGKLLGLGWKYDQISMFGDWLHKLPLKEWLKGDKISWANFDICGELTPDLASWIAREVRPELFMPKARVFFTFANPRENGKHLWVATARKMLNGPGVKVLWPLVTNGYYVKPAILEKLHVTGNVLFHALGDFRRTRIECVPYRDTKCPMAYFGFEVANKKTRSKFVKLQAFLDEYRERSATKRWVPRVAKWKNPKRVAAAHKAWETMRTNA